MNKTENLPLKPKLIYDLDTQKSIPLKSDKLSK